MQVFCSFCLICFTVIYFSGNAVLQANSDNVARRENNIYNRDSKEADSGAQQFLSHLVIMSSENGLWEALDLYIYGPGAVDP